MNQHKRLKGTKALVKDIFIEHPDWNAKQIYDRYLILIADPQKAVTLNAVQKHVEEFKTTYYSEKFQALQKEWHLGTLLDHPIAPEDVAKIIKYKLRMRRSLTIREALWMARLSGLPLSVDWLAFFGRRYARNEELYYLIGEEFAFNEEFDSFLLKMLREHPDNLLKDMKPLSDEKLIKHWENMIRPITPELFKDVTEKLNKHKRTVKNERPHSPEVH